MKNLEKNSSKIIDIKEDQFNEMVIEASAEKLILVDFWAPWCGPCKQLSPLLEDVVENSGQKVLLVKINIDENKNLAAQLKIQSIPTVIAVKAKQIVNGFQGVLPKNKIVEFIEKILGEKINEDHTSFYNEIKNFISDKNFDQALEALEEFFVEHSDNLKAINLYLECLINLKKFDETEKFIDGLSEEILKSKELKQAINLLNIKKNNQKGPSLENLINKFENNPKDVNLLISLSEKYFAENNISEACKILLENYKFFDEKTKIKLKKTLLKYFDALGNEHEDTKRFRKKLSSLIFS